MGRAAVRRAGGHHRGDRPGACQGRSGRGRRGFVARGVRMRASELVRHRSRGDGGERASGQLGREGRRAAHVLAEGGRHRQAEVPLRSEARGQARGRQGVPARSQRHGLEPGRAAGGARRRYEGRVLLQLQRRAGLRPAEGVARGVGEDRSRGHHRRADVRDGARVRLRAARVHLPRAHGAPRVHRRQETLRGHAHAGARAHPPRDEAVR